MRVLIACEFSGTVRDAFLAKGHDAMSCDFLDTESPGPHHVGDALALLKQDWDLLIAHPPCTYLTNSGARWLYGGKGKVKDPKRWAHMIAGASLFKAFLDADVPRIAVENPIMHGHAKKIIGRQQSQVIQPWQHGEPETKATCLWLKGLPLLTPSNIVEGREPRVHHASPGPDRWKLRSLTPKGIALAMADQWG